MNILLYAHSGDGFDPQFYSEHVKNVYEGAIDRVIRTLTKSTLSTIQKNFFMDVVSISSIYHDLGKLDPNSQYILSQKKTLTGVKMLNHVDAGVGHCLNEYTKTKNLAYLVSAYLIHAHHIGLQDWGGLVKQTNGGLFGGVVYHILNDFRDERDLERTYGIVSKNDSIREYVDKTLPRLLDSQHVSFPLVYQSKTNETKHIPLSFFDIRVALSCLVDSDHTDTSNFYNQKNVELAFVPNTLDAYDRLEYLKNYVSSLPKKGSKKRQSMRKLLWELSYSGDLPEADLHCVDGPVGSGKTTAMLAYALRLADKYECERVNVVLPFINIINQTVDTYQKAILAGDEEKETVNAIHSKCEFEYFLLRRYSRTWKYPFNITTAVRFFESLTSNRPASLRKLHLFANSVIILDEFHQSTQHGYWDYNLHLLEQLRRYNTHFVAGSGTSVYYWDIFNNHHLKVHQIVNGKDYKRLQNAEEKRVERITIKRPYTDITVFCQRVLKEPGQSKLVVLNTIRNALVVGKMMKELTKAYELFHISTCLNQTDKEKILARIKTALNEKKKVLVIATSIIECGVDISFQVGFREKIGLLQREQFGGRIGRNEEWKTSKTYVFEFHDKLKGKDGILTENPANGTAIEVFDSLHPKQLTPKYCTEAVKRELELDGTLDEFLPLEKQGQLQRINDEYKVINQHTACIIIDKSIVERMKKNQFINPTEIANNLVQVYFSKVERFMELGLVTKLSDVLQQSIVEGNCDGEYFKPESDDDYYVWNGRYDSDFYGIGIEFV